MVSVKDDTSNSSKLIPEYGYERRFSEWSWRLCKIHPFWQGFEKCEKPVDADTHRVDHLWFRSELLWRGRLRADLPYIERVMPFDPWVLRRLKSYNPRGLPAVDVVVMSHYTGSRF